MKVVYASRALRNIDDILAYIKAGSPLGARSVSLAIEHAIRTCALSPHASAKTDQRGVYRRPLGMYRYTIFYRILAGGEGIEVARVIHGARVRNLRRMPNEPESGG
jgi:plasmid stabilization system protein ParE